MRKGKWLIVFFVVLTLAWCLPIFVEEWISRRPLPPDLAWEVKLDSNPSHVTVDAEQQVLLAGSQVVKLEGSSGGTRWTQRVVLPHPASYKGDVYLVGAEARGYRPGPIAPPFSGSNTDFAVCKVLSNNGDVVWKNSFDGGHRDTDWAEKVVIAPDGDPIAAGFTPDDTHYFGCVAKLDARDGKVTWQYRTSEASVELWHNSSALVVDRDSGVFFGSSRRPSEVISSQISFWITKLRVDDGRPIWTAEFPSDVQKSHVLTHMATTKEGDLIAVGYHAKPRGRSLVVARFSGVDGHLIWSDEQDASSHETIEPTCIVIDDAGRVFVSARSWNGSLTTPRFDRWMLNLSAIDGHRIWANREDGKQMPFAAGEICSTSKIILGETDLIVCVGSVWNGNNVDVRVDWLSRVDGKIARSIQYDGAAHDHDLFRDASSISSSEVVVAIRSSRCPQWLKPWRELQHLLKGGADWRSIHSETNRVDDPDPYNYDNVVVKSRGQTH